MKANQCAYVGADGRCRTLTVGRLCREHRTRAEGGRIVQTVELYKPRKPKPRPRPKLNGHAVT